MCTAATYKTKDFYMGRTLDYEFAYGEEVTVMPRNYPLHFRYMGDMSEHFAIIGMAHVADNYPLYYDAVNEKGLGMAVTVECTASGLQVYDNPVGVLTNNPPFDMQMFALNNYAGLSSRQPDNTFADKLKLNAYSRGMGAMGLPGDLSSRSRFARVAYTKMNSRSGDSENESVSQFFHILGSVEQQRGCCEVADGKYEITIYTCCCNTTKGLYYYTSYDNHQICAVDMHKENLDDDKLVRYPLITDGEIRAVN